MASDVPSSMYHDEAFIDVIDLLTDKQKILLKKESMGSEKQISVDPVSLRESSNQQQTVMYPPITCPTTNQMIPLAPRRRTNFASQSLLNSVSSSPRVVPNVTKRNQKHCHSVSSSLQRQDSIALANLDRLWEIHLQRSKSCGQGRPSGPLEDFDLWVTSKPVNVQNEPNDDEYTNFHFNNYATNVGNNVTTVDDRTDTIDEKFKCKAICLHLPAFGKVKPVRARRQSSDVSQAKEEETGHVVSKRASLEKFECASLDSSAFINDDDEDTSNLFFDLPLELIKCSISDTHSPVTTGFVFDKEPKGVLKNSNSNSSVKCKSTDSSVRHVRFSTSSPISYPESPTYCVVPSMCNARDDFSIFIEAQST
ncbi:hypothetical protein Leryth_025430 [Lithospermum erythrorhizon]|nr:hypothetical protein Leryth_025430 [Lithospermum erythrorhizon]